MKPIGYPYGATKAAMCLRPRVATLGSKLRDAIKRKRVRQKDVAQAVGVRPPTVSQWVNDIEKPGRDRLVMLANYLGTSVDELMKEDEFNDKGPLTQIEAPASLVRTEVRLAHIAEPYFRQMPQNVPVLGTGAGSQEGEFNLNGEISEYVRRPPGIANAPQVFAIWVTGNSMYPRFTEGELAFVHPGRQARSGDDVLIELKATVDGTRPAFVKRLLRRTPTQLVVEQFNPPGEITFSLETVASVFRILTVADLMGI